MANSTVYPYGTGGQLPSGIAIVNDLTTGGADMALSAEQGKVIGEMLGVEPSIVVDKTVLASALQDGVTKTFPVDIVSGRTYTIAWSGATANSTILSVSFGNASSTTQTTSLNVTTLTTESGYVTVNANVNATRLRVNCHSPLVSSIVLSHEGRGTTILDDIQDSLYDTWSMTNLSWLNKSGINVNTGAISSDSNAICSRTFLPIQKFSKDGKLLFKTVTSNLYYFVVALYSSASESSFLGRIGFTTSLEIDWSTSYPSSSYFRIALVYKDSTGATVLSAGISDEFNLQDVFLLYNSTLQDVSIGSNNSARIDTQRKEVLRKKITTSIYSGQGFCKYGEYWLSAKKSNDSFDSAASNYGYIYIYDSSFAQVGSIRHNLGHVSCLSYCESKNAFISSNGNANVYPRLDILLNASQHVTAALNSETSDYLYGASDVASIPLHTSSKDLISNGDAGVWCFGGNDRYVYLSVRNRTTAVRTFFKGILGVGTADFSDSGTTDTSSWGTYASGRTSDEFNGTLRILERYEGENIVSAQGIDYYNGNLILSSGTTSIDINVLNLFDGQYQIVGYYRLSNLANDGSAVSTEPEDLTVDDGLIYLNTTIGTFKLLM